jgi:SNARE protein
MVRRDGREKEEREMGWWVFSSSTSHPHPHPFYLSSPAKALSAPELIAAGRTLIAETDASLLRSARVVAQTMEVGSKTAAALSDQAAQLERILDDADAMRGAARKARRVIVEVARGAATDR